MTPEAEAFFNYLSDTPTFVYILIGVLGYIVGVVTSIICGACEEFHYIALEYRHKKRMSDYIKKRLDKSCKDIETFVDSVIDRENG